MHTYTSCLLINDALCHLMTLSSGRQLLDAVFDHLPLELYKNKPLFFEAYLIHNIMSLIPSKMNE